MIAPLAIIAEDEPLLRAEIRETLRLLWPELRICAEVGDGQQAVDALEQFGPNILFLDIHMPGLNGIEVARQASGKAHVVFITAYDNYAVDAFKDGALDYIVKPISPERMKVTVGGRVLFVRKVAVSLLHRTSARPKLLIRRAAQRSARLEIGTCRGS